MLGINTLGHVLDILRIKTGLEPNFCSLFLEGPEIIPQNPGASWNIKGLYGMIEENSSQII